MANENASGNQQGSTEPGRTATEAESGARSPQAPGESTRTQSKAEGDRDTVEESLQQKGS